MTELSKISQNYLTDKGVAYENPHCYTEIYDHYFKHFKEEGRKVFILEIGVQYGNDLLMMNEYFGGNCEIYGFDIDISQIKVDLPENIHVFNINGTDRDTINNWYLSKRYFKSAIFNIPIFDIIIDDGSHISGDILTTLTLFYNRLSNDGIYIIEDIHSSDAQETLFYLNFGHLPNGSITPELETVNRHLKRCSVYHLFDNYCQQYKASICAILTFNNFDRYNPYLEATFRELDKNE